MANWLKGYITYIGATGTLLVAIAAFANGTISLEALLVAIGLFITAIGGARKGNRIETKIEDLNSTKSKE